MIRSILFCGIFLQCCVILTAQESQFSLPDLSATEYENADAIVLERTRHLEIHNRQRATLKEYEVLLILNESGIGQGHFSVYYDGHEKVTDVRCSLSDLNGKVIRKFKRSDLKDESLTGGGNLHDDARRKYIEINAATFPAVVIREYEKEFDGLFNYPSWWAQDNYRQAVFKGQLKVTVPGELDLRYFATFSDSLPDIIEEGDEKTYRWSLENLNPIERENFALNPNERFPIVYLAPNDFHYAGLDGSMNSWKELGEWLNNLLEGRSELNQTKQHEIRHLVNNKQTQKEKVETIYHHLQAHTRYVSIQLGIGGYQPFSAQSVADNGYGDCKALSNYMRAMLHTIDIPSYYTIIGAGRAHRSFTNPRFPNAFQANHVILTVPLQEDTLFLECTSQENPCGYLGSFTDNRAALMLGPQGGELIKTKQYHQGENLRIRTVDMQISSLGNLTAEVQTNFVGLAYDHRAGQLRRTEQEQIKQLLKTLNIVGLEIESVDYRSEKGVIPEIEEELRLKASNYGNRSGKRMFIKPNLMSRWTIRLPKTEERHSDIYIAEAKHHRDTINMKLPSGYTIEALPTDCELASEFGLYQIKFQKSEENLQVVRAFDLPEGTYPRETYEDLRIWLEGVSKADDGIMVLVQQKT